MNGNVSFSDPQGISSGAFGLWLEPRDMAKIGYLYLRNGKWEGKQLLPDAWIDKIKHATIDAHIPEEPGLSYSNLFWVLPNKHVYVANGLYGQNIVVFPDLDIVAVTTALLTAAAVEMDALVKALSTTFSCVGAAFGILIFWLGTCERSTPWSLEPSMLICFILVM